MIRVEVIGFIERNFCGRFLRHVVIEYETPYYPVTGKTVIVERNLDWEGPGAIVEPTPFFKHAQQLLRKTGLVDDVCICEPDQKGADCMCTPDDACVFYLEYFNNPHKVFLVHPAENDRLRAFLKRPDPFHRVAEILEHHLEVGLDLTAVQANAAEHAAENDKPKKRAKKE